VKAVGARNGEAGARSDDLATQSASSSTKPGGFQAAKEQWLMNLASYPNLSAADLAVALVIFKHLNSKTNWAWPSMALIAEMTNREESTVWKSINKLEALELLYVSRGRGRNVVNKYQPRLGAIDCDPKTLRRGRKNTANWKKKHCELEGRTSKEM
jgi:hypothetical protein